MNYQVLTGEIPQVGHDRDRERTKARGTPYVARIQDTGLAMAILRKTDLFTQVH